MPSGLASNVGRTSVVLNWEISSSSTGELDVDRSGEAEEPVVTCPLETPLFSVAAAAWMSCSSTRPASVGRLVGAWGRRVTAELRGAPLAEVAPADRVIVKRRTPEKLFAIGMVMPVDQGLAKS